MTRIHDNKVNKISEYNLLHDIINPPKFSKKLSSHYSPILHGCMNTRKCEAKFKKFWILLVKGCSSTNLMGRVVENVSWKRCCDAVAHAGWKYYY